MIVRPPVFVFPQRGTVPAKHPLCSSVLSLPMMVLVPQNVNAFKLLNARNTSVNSVANITVITDSI